MSPPQSGFAGWIPFLLLFVFGGVWVGGGADRYQRPKPASRRTLLDCTERTRNVTQARDGYLILAEIHLLILTLRLTFVCLV